jgi:leader peptidase (prepilin peptidase) / N-methyltransferase
MSELMLHASVLGVFGLLIGSFLNVVIYRLPRMMEAQWAAEYKDAENEKSHEVRPAFNLLIPRSHCFACGHRLSWYENVPVASYLALRGKCSACSAPISARYPAIEAFTGLVFAVCGARWGLSTIAVLWATFASILICQFWIDFDTQLLPDDLNYPLLWLGLIAASLGLTIRLDLAVWGAALGYVLLWSVYQGHKLLTGQEGMGYGDFKLMAALGAWFGADYLLALILVSSLVGAVIGGILLLVGKLANKDIPIAFGPFIAGAGLTCLLIGPAQVRQLAPFMFPFSNL